MLFGREAQIIVGNKKFTLNDFALEFDIKLDDNPEPNTGEVVLYNLSRPTINEMKKDDPVTVAAGYNGDVGTVAAGFAKGLETKHQGVDRQTEIMFIDAGDTWLRVNIQASYKEGIRASRVLDDMFAQAGLEVGDMKLPEDKIYTNGLVVSGPLSEEARKIAKDCGAKLHTLENTVYIRPQEEGKQTAFVLSRDTGLIESPERVENGDGVDFNVFCFLNHRIKPDTVVKIESETASGLFRVRKSRIVCNERDFMNHLEVVVL